MANVPQSSSGGGPFKRHIAEKKKEEYQDYGQEIGALAALCTMPRRSWSGYEVETS